MPLSRVSEPDHTEGQNALLRDADGTLRAFMDGNRQKSLHLAENRLFID
jgi:hypothetical protein